MRKLLYLYPLASQATDPVARSRSPRRGRVRRRGLLLLLVLGPARWPLAALREATCPGVGSKLSLAEAVCWDRQHRRRGLARGSRSGEARGASPSNRCSEELADLLPKMPKKEKKPPTAEEIAEMLGVAAEKTFKVEQDHIPKVCFVPSRPTAPLLRRLRRASCRPGAPLRCQLQG